MNKRLLFLVMACAAFPAVAQIPTDGLLMPARTFCTGFLYQHDQWKNYWEGSLKRDNKNIGTLTTQNTMWYGVYGLTNKINIMASVPFIKTDASGGTLHGMTGVQDLMLSVKYKFISVEAGPGKFGAFVGGSFSTPLTDYTPDFLPLSIGMASTTVGARLNLNYALMNGFYVNGSTAYTYRSNTFLDRPAYYTDGHYYSTNEVRMPNMYDYKLDVGYHKGAIQAELAFSQMYTLGGGDIRRQDMPFVSNRMNATRVSALIMYYVPFVKNLGVRAMVSQVIDGRNVGQTTSILGGLLYTFHFNKKGDIKDEIK